MTASQADVENQLEVALGGQSATDHIEEGMTPLTQFLMYRLQILENSYPDAWVVANVAAICTNKGRAAIVRKFQRPYSSLRDPERTHCIRFLMSLFHEKPPPCSIGEAQLNNLVTAILQSRFRFERHFVEGATRFESQEQYCTGYRFPLTAMPGPTPVSQNWFEWYHGTAQDGLCGMLCIGRVLPTDRDVACLRPDEHSFSFYGRACSTPDHLPAVLNMVTSVYHSTKNACGVIVAGYLPSSHTKAKRASVDHENRLCRHSPLVHSIAGDRRWAIRFTAARIDALYVVSDIGTANFPPSAETLEQRRKRKAILARSPKAIQFASEDDWGQWRARDSSDQQDQPSQPSEIKVERSPEEEPETPNLMAAASEFSG